MLQIANVNIEAARLTGYAVFNKTRRSMRRKTGEGGDVYDECIDANGQGLAEESVPVVESCKVQVLVPDAGAGVGVRHPV